MAVLGTVGPVALVAVLGLVNTRRSPTSMGYLVRR